MYVIMKNAGLSANEINTKVEMEKDIEEIRSKLARNNSEFTNEKNRLQTEIANLKDLNIKLEKDKANIADKCKTYENENNNIKNQCKTLKEEKKNLETQINNLNNDLSKFLIILVIITIMIILVKFD